MIIEIYEDFRYCCNNCINDEKREIFYKTVFFDIYDVFFKINDINVLVVVRIDNLKLK